MSQRRKAGRRRRVVTPKPERVRSLTGTHFGWIDARLLRAGWLQALTPQATAAYTFLCLAADRSGVSYYRRDRIGRGVGLSEDELHQTLRLLEELDLVAFRPFGPRAVDGFRQVLSLPDGPAPTSVSHYRDLIDRIGRLPEDRP